MAVPQQTKRALIQALGGIGRAAMGAYVQQPVATSKRKRRVKKRGECSPCAAMDAVDKAHQRVRNGTL